MKSETRTAYSFPRGPRKLEKTDALAVYARARPALPPGAIMRRAHIVGCPLGAGRIGNPRPPFRSRVCCNRSFCFSSPFYFVLQPLFLFFLPFLFLLGPGAHGRR